MLHNSLFTLINIGGLAIGLSSCVFITYYVYDELTFDRFHKKADRIYRITSAFGSTRLRFTDQKIGPYLKRLNPQVEEFVRFDGFNANFQSENELIKEDGIFFTDRSVFEVFTFQIVAGDPTKVFAKGKNGIVISESLASKYFQKEALGKTLIINKDPYEVTGIMKDVPANSDKWVNGLVYGDFPGEELADFNVGFDTYVLLKPGVGQNEFKDQLSQLANALWANAGNKPLYEIQPLTDLHFTQGIQMDNAKGNKANIYIFLIVGGILLLVVIFNFINLTTVKSLERAKEVGIRKVVGAMPAQLVGQFMGESLLTTIMATLIAFAIVVGLHPLFSFVTGKTILFTSSQNILLVAKLFLILSFIALVPSLYPAMVLSSYRPVVVLKGGFWHRRSGNSVRKIFIVGQFCLSTSLLVFLITVVLQTRKFNQSDLGFNPHEVVVFWLPHQMKNEVLKCDGVLQVGSGGLHSIPGESLGSTTIWFNDTGTEQQLQVQQISGDADYPEVMELQIIQGKPIKSYPESQWMNLALVNETLARQAGWDNPVGMEIETSTIDGGNDRRKVTIVGVWRDFHFKSLHNSIDPLVYFPALTEWHLFARITPGRLEDFKKSWGKNMPDRQFGYLLDEGFENQYKAEETLLVLLVSLTILTILLAGLGLYGLTTYIVQTRTKEVGIRKVLGAQVGSIISLLSTDFLKLVLIGSLCGSIISIQYSGNWLDTFAYRVEPEWWQWTIPAIVITCFSVLVIAYRTYSVAQSNPTESLRYE